MPIKYPNVVPLSANASVDEHIAVKLPTSSDVDVSMDVYTFNKTAGGNICYSVIIIANTQDEANASTLLVSNIELSSQATNDGFTLDPLVSGSLEMGDGTNEGNKVKDTSELTNYDETAGTPDAFDGTTSVLILPPLDSGNTEDITLDNISSLPVTTDADSMRIIPLYKTTDITAANGVTNPIESNEYAAFLLKYEPTGNVVGGSSTLSIATNHSIATINLSYNAQNTADVVLKSGSYTETTANSVNIGNIGNAIANDGEVNLGLYPVGTQSAYTKGIFIFDQSANATNELQLVGASNSAEIGVSQTYGTNFADDANSVPFNFSEGFKQKFLVRTDNIQSFASFNQGWNETKYFIQCTPSTSGILNGDNTSLSLTGSTITGASDFEKGDITMKMQLEVALQNNLVEPTPITKQVFITTGFYNQSTFVTEAEDIDNKNGSIVIFGFVSIPNLNKSTAGTLRGLTDQMYAGDTFNVDIIYRWHNYSGSSYVFPGSLTPSNDLVATTGLLESDGKPTKYVYNTDVTTGLDAGTGASTANTSISDIGTPSNNENVKIALRYPAKPNLKLNSIYNTAFSNSGISGNIERTLVTTNDLNSQGLVKSTLTLENNANSTPLSKLNGSVTYTINFYPREATLKFLPKQGSDTDFYNSRPTLDEISVGGSINIGTTGTVYSSTRGEVESVSQWYVVDATTTVANTSASFAAYEGGTINSANNNVVSSSDYETTYYSGEDGVYEKNVFNGSTVEILANPTPRILKNSDGTTVNLFTPYNNIIKVTAALNSSDSYWYGALDFRFGNSGNYDIMLYDVTIEPSNMTDASSTPVKPSGSNTPYYAVSTPATKNTFANGDMDNTSDGQTTSCVINPGTSGNVDDIWPVDQTSLANNNWNHCAILGNIGNSYDKDFSSVVVNGVGTNFKSRYTGGTCRAQFKLLNNASAEGDYYSMVTVRYYKNDYENNTAGIFNGVNNTLGHANSRLYSARYIVKFSVVPDTEFQVLDADTSTDQELNDLTIDFGTILVD